MADFVFVGVLIAFFAFCVFYVNWCDRIIGPDDFASSGSADTGSTDTMSGAAAGGDIASDRASSDDTARTGVTA